MNYKISLRHSDGSLHVFFASGTEVTVEPLTDQQVASYRLRGWISDERNWWQPQKVSQKRRKARTNDTGGA